MRLLRAFHKFTLNEWTDAMIDRKTNTDYHRFKHFFLCFSLLEPKIWYQDYFFLTSLVWIKTLNMGKLEAFQIFSPVSCLRWIFRFFGLLKSFEIILFGPSERGKSKSQIIYELLACSSTRYVDSSLASSNQPSDVRYHAERDLLFVIICKILTWWR